MKDTENENQAGAESYPPINMVLHCPACGMQHIDEKEFDGDRVDPYPSSTGEDDPALSWDNPPHRSHLCHGCGYIWRPADVPTNGVAAVKTTGKADSPLATAALRARGAVPSDAEIDAVWREGALREGCEPSIRSQFRWAAREVLGRYAAPAAPMSARGAVPCKPLGTIVLNVNGRPVSAFEHRGVAQYVDPEIYDATYPQNAPHRLAHLVEQVAAPAAPMSAQASEPLGTVIGNDAVSEFTCSVWAGSVPPVGAYVYAAPQPPAALPGEQDAARRACDRCQGSGEDPEGFYDQSRGPEGDTHSGPCRECGGSGAPAIEQDARDAARYRAIRDVSEGVSIASTWNGNDGHTLHIKGDELDECADSWMVIAKERAAKGRTDGGEPA